MKPLPGWARTKGIRIWLRMIWSRFYKPKVSSSRTVHCTVHDSDEIHASIKLHAIKIWLSRRIELQKVWPQWLRKEISKANTLYFTREFQLSCPEAFFLDRSPSFCALPFNYYSFDFFICLNCRNSWHLLHVLAEFGQRIQALVKVAQRPQSTPWGREKQYMYNQGQSRPWGREYSIRSARDHSWVEPGVVRNEGCIYNILGCSV